MWPQFLDTLFLMILNVQDLLMDVRDKLLFEPEYAGNLKEKIAPKSPLRIPWAWLPGALCLLQEVLLLSFYCFFFLKCFVLIFLH